VVQLQPNYMNKLLKSTLSLSLLSTLCVATQALAQTPTVPRRPPNTTFRVESQSGRCPRSVGLWTSFRYYEGGGEHTVIANTTAIAGPARLISSGKKFAQFRAPLQRAYASCIGQANSSTDDFPYQFVFNAGNVTFRVQLPPDTESNPSAMTYHNVMSSRPMVRWAIAD
jgi:hypothetical protein